MMKMRMLTITALAVMGFGANAAVDLAEYNTVIHPGKEDGTGFWNEKARWFTYAPSFPFSRVDGAKSFRFTITDSKGGRLTFDADTPKADLSRVWAAVPVAMITVVCEGLDAEGKVIGKAGERTFWKMPGFDPEFSPKPDRDLKAAAKALYANIFNRKETQYLLETGKLDLTDLINSYASKNGAALINAMVYYASLDPAQKERALLVARKAAEYLISLSEPAGAPLEYFPPTYAGPGERTVGTDNAGTIMMIYPARVINSYIGLWKATGEQRYFDHAVKIGETYLKLQGEDGTWYLKVFTKDGKPCNPNRLLPIGSAIEALETLYEVTGRGEFRQAADRAFDYIDRTRMADWNWEGQFEDITPTKPYQNLTKHGAGSFAIYLGRRFPGDPRRIAQMRELLRFCEDQFVCWQPPYDGAERHEFGGAKHPGRILARWLTPCALEQYECYWPIDASASKMINVYLALYKAEGKLEDLMKARALASSILKSQRPDGSIPTWWFNWDGKKCNNGRDWQNCMIASAQALEALAEAETWYPKNRKAVLRKTTPVMGWSSWNSFGESVNKEKVKSQADALVSLGLRDLGWNYINIDDCYQNGRDPKTGRLRINLKKFPGGEADMKYLADYCHSLRLKAGIYSDGGDNSCWSGNERSEGLNVGLYQHEREDLEMFFGDGLGCWGYDFIKIDWCGGGHAKLRDCDQYNKIMDIIDDIEHRTGKDKIINICRWRYIGPWQFRADSWRSGPDISMKGDSWESVMVQVDIIKDIWQNTRPGSMNDPDMLVAGLQLTPEEDKSHFAMWCMFSSPLLIGQDLTKIKPETLALYKNTELIAINQDPAVLSAAYLGEVVPGVEVWVKMLGGDRSTVRALALLNRNTQKCKVSFVYRKAGYLGKVRARDLFAHRDLPIGYMHTVELPPHGIEVLKLEPADGQTVRGFALDQRAKETCRSEEKEESRRIDWVNAMHLVRGGAKLIDVRKPEEFATGHVEGAVNMPHETIVAAVKGAVANTNAALVCYCRSYKRAAQAANLLDLAGYRNVKFVGDGYEAFKTMSTATLKDVAVFVSDIKAGKVEGMAAEKWRDPWPSALGKPDVAWNDKPISIAGNTYAKGVGNVAKILGGGTLVTCAIPKGATHFVAMAGVDDNTTDREGVVRFEIHVDGRQVAVAPEMKVGQEHLFSIELPKGAKMIKLFASGEGPMTSWGGAGFVVGK